MPIPILADFLGNNVAVNAGVATATGSSLTPTIEDRRAKATGTAYDATITIGRVVSAGLASATGTAQRAVTLPVNVTTIQGITTLDAPTQLVLVVVSTIDASTTLDSVTLDGSVIATGVSATTSLATPVILTTTSSKWSFYDPETFVTYSFEISPSSGNPTRTKNLVYKNTLGPSARTLAYETERGNEFSWSGTILSEDEYYEFVDWFNKRYPITVTDDLGRSYSVYLTEFAPKRERRLSHPWFHTYEMKAERC